MTKAEEVILRQLCLTQAMLTGILHSMFNGPEQEQRVMQEFVEMAEEIYEGLVKDMDSKL